MFGWLANLITPTPTAAMPTARAGRRPVRARAGRALAGKYDAAATNDENRRHWAHADLLAADAANDPQVRRVLRARARYEVANNSYARGIVLTLANDCVGTGPRLQMLSADAGANRTIELEFARWAESTRLAEKLRTMRMAKAQDGEAFALLSANPKADSPVKLDLRPVEADQVATPPQVTTKGRADARATDGIVFDGWGNPVEYHVLRSHPGGPAGSAPGFDRVPAGAVVHYYRVDRPGQSRGVPEITPALPLPDPIYRWCGSPAEPWLTHAPEDDSVTTTQMPYLTRHLPGRAEPVTVFDADVWTEVNDELDTPDKCYTPHAFKTIRGLQLACELLCTGFVEPVDHTGRNAIVNFNLATFFECLGVNAASATVTAVDLASGKTHFAPGIAGMFLEDAHDATIACLDGHKVRWVRQATLGLATSAATLDFAVSEDDVGKRLAFAFGWTRKLPREFIRFYRQSIFVPDFGADTGEPVLPPTATYPGAWQHLGPSDHYKTTSALGFVGDSADSHDLIQDGELARYSGQNWNDPTLGIRGTDTDAPLARVRNTQYVGRKRPGWSFGDAGTVSAGGTWWLRDQAKSWFAEGTLIEHSGTATAGGTTSLTDAGKAADPFWITAGQGRFAGHVLEVTTGPHADTRVPIDGSAGTTLTFRDLGFSTAGLGYRIREPAYELNRWQGRVLRVTRADGTALPDITITHSDDDTLYFAAQAEAVQPGWTYRIVEASTGTVWLRQAGKWVVPPPEVHGRNQHAVRPTVVRRYGRYMKGDYLPAGLFDEIQKAINVMRHVARPASWSAFAEPWVDAPLASGVADGGGEGSLSNSDATFGPELVGKHVQVRSWATGAMSRFAITGVDGSTLYFDGAGFAAGWGDDYWLLEPAARDVVPNDRVVADSVGGGNVNDWLDQYGRAASDWAAPRYPGQRPRVADGKAPRCLTLGSDYQGLGEPGVYYYSAALHGTHAYGRADLPYRNWDGASFSAQTDFYDLTEYGQPRVLPPHEAQFIANGEAGQLQWWVKFDTKASRTDGNPTMSRRFGDVSTCPAAGQAPPPPPEPDGSTIFDTANGYVVADAKAIMRFETSGLLTYL